ncbi:MAG: S-methyl-5-thioribose-1-phosphate isomerase [Spirochaetes bacterium]|nr:S-methyl-5-thioribose-1-phosphate isomerase [Spirochaetota bacterium]
MKVKFKPIDYKNGKLRIIDQTALPQKLQYIDITDYRRLGTAIRNMELRGAPLLGIAGAYGLVLGTCDFNEENFDKFYMLFQNIKDHLAATRPTAVNLFYTLNRMEKVVLESNEKSIGTVKKILKTEADKIYKEDLELSEKIGIHGSKLIKNNDVILTHCNAGGLATSGLGTALAVLFTSKAQNKKFRVFATETRPLLQGARLTTWELLKYNIDATLICDSMAAYAIKKKSINKIIVGADRIARNGDTANKIGTYNLAILAKFHKIPFYIAAPSTTFDFSLKNGESIPIEERKKEELISCNGHATAPPKVNVFNPAFDVVPNNLITGIITEAGILLHPFSKSFKKLS